MIQELREVDQGWRRQRAAVDERGSGVGGCDRGEQVRSDSEQQEAGGDAAHDGARAQVTDDALA